MIFGALPKSGRSAPDSLSLCWADGSGLHERGLDVDLPLAVHPVEVDRLAKLIENDNADPHTALDGRLPSHEFFI